MPFTTGEAPPNKGRTFKAEVLTATEVRAILAQCSRTAPTGIRDRALIALMWRAGLRVSEALDLMPKDVNMAAGEVTVLRGKGDRQRTLGLDDDTLSVLQVWLDRRKTFGFRSAPLFCTLGGDEISDQQVRGMLRRRAAKAGIAKRVHPHGLRHTYASELNREGVPVTHIQRNLGHAHLSTTQTYLDHIAPTEVIAVNRTRPGWQE
jgi:integrase/recombinase XerD